MPPGGAVVAPVTGDEGGVGGQAPSLSTPPASGGGGGDGGEAKRFDPLAGMIPEAPTGMYDAAVPSSDPHQAPSSSYTHDPTAPAPYGEPSAGGGGGGYPPGASAPPPSSAYSSHVAPAPAPYIAPVPRPYVPSAPAPAPYVAPAPAPTPAPAKQEYSPQPPRPRTPVPSSAGPRRAGGSRPMEGNMADAMEHCRFAIRALEHKDVELAVQKLQEALRQIT